MKIKPEISVKHEPQKKHICCIACLDETAPLFQLRIRSTLHTLCPSCLTLVSESIRPHIESAPTTLPSK